METSLILIFSLLYVLANRFLAPYFYSREKLDQYRKQYMKTYKDLLTSVNASEEELAKKQKQLLDISNKQLKESMKSMVFTLVLFMSIYAAIDYLYPVKFTSEPTNDICIAYSNGTMYMFENGSIKTIEFLPFFGPKIVNITPEKFDCGEAVIYLPIQIGNLNYIYGYKRIFIFYVFVLSIVVGILENIYKYFKNNVLNKGP